MSNTSCVIFIPDDTGRTGLPQPLMLTATASAPLLWHLGQSLKEKGIKRIFLVCHGQYLAAARACLERDFVVSASDNEDAADLLHVFLSTDEEEQETLCVITAPCAPQKHNAEPDTAAPNCSLLVQREELMCALDENVPFDAFLRKQGQAADHSLGLAAVQSAGELQRLAPLLLQLHIERLQRGGVIIPSPEQCYINPTVRIGRGTMLLAGVTLRDGCEIGEGCTIGPNVNLFKTKLEAGCTVIESFSDGCEIGENCNIGPYAVLRSSTLGAECNVGSFAELERAVLRDGVQVPRLAYVADATLEKNSYIGAMSATVNFDRAGYHEIHVEKDAFIGAGVQLVAPVQIGQGAYIAAGSTVTDNVGAHALVLARSKQASRRGWAAHYKLPKENKLK